MVPSGCSEDTPEVTAPVVVVDDGCRTEQSVTSLRKVWSMPGGVGFAVGKKGAIWRFAASRWGHVSSGTSVDLHDVSGASKYDVWAVGDGGVILHYDGEWRSVKSGTDADLYGVWAHDRKPGGRRR